MEKCGFTLNMNLIPALLSEGIEFGCVDDVHNTTKILVLYNHRVICRVEAIRELCTNYCYKVTWARAIHAVRFFSNYKHFTALIDDIKIAIKDLKNRGENKMDKKKYRVSDIRFSSSPDQMDEITFTVNVLRSSCAIREDCEMIRDAIENIGEKNETHYIVCGRGNGKTKMFMNDNYHGGFTTWRNEYQKERDKFDIKDVIFNNPATIVFWEDGTKTVVKAENEEFDPEKGLAMAIAKKALGNNYDYYDVFKKYVGRYEKKQKKGGK